MSNMNTMSNTYNKLLNEEYANMLAGLQTYFNMHNMLDLIKMLNMHNI
jgi:hypothetical protein